MNMWNEIVYLELWRGEISDHSCWPLPALHMVWVTRTTVRTRYCQPAPAPHESCTKPGTWNKTTTMIYAGKHQSPLWIPGLNCFNFPYILSWHCSFRSHCTACNCYRSVLVRSFIDLFVFPTVQIKGAVITCDLTKIIFFRIASL